MSQLPGVAWIVQDSQSDCNEIVLQRCGAWIQEEIFWYCIDYASFTFSLVIFSQEKGPKKRNK